LARRASGLRALERRVRFEIRLFIFSLYYYGETIALALMRRFDRSERGKRIVALYDESMAEPPRI
jgi:hypothetical protein